MTTTLEQRIDLIETLGRQGLVNLGYDARQANTMCDRKFMTQENIDFVKSQSEQEFQQGINELKERAGLV